MDFYLLMVIGLSLFLGGFIKGFSGFGTSIVLTGLLLVFFDPKMIIPVLAILSLTLNFYLLKEHWVHIKQMSHNFAFKPETIISLLIGTYIGVKILIFVNVNVIKLFFGIMIFVFIYLIKHKIKHHKHILTNKESHIIIGGVAGFLSGLINVNGPPPVLYGLYHHYNKVKLVKSVIVFYIIADIITILTFYFNGLYSYESIKLYLPFIPILSMGFLIGKQLRKVTTDVKFKKYTVLLLVVIALKMIFDGITNVF